MTRQPSRRLLAALSLLALAACGDSEITGGAKEVGGPALDFGLDPANARGIAGGTSSIRGYQVTSISPTLSADAFNRGGETNAAIGYSTTTCPGLGGTHCYLYRDWYRVGEPRDGLWFTDPRLPTIVQRPLRDSVGFFSVGGPEHFGIPMFEIFGRVFGLTPNQPYFMSLVRYGLEVRGALDAVERLVFGTVTQPDSLVVISPNPGGYPAVNYEWITNAACANNAVVVGANPLYLGPATALSTGRVTFDKCIGSGNLYYKNFTRVVPDSSPFLPNSLEPHVIAQQYNYIEITEGNTPGGPVVGRIQVGPDLNPATNLPIPNSFAPFPTGALSPGILIATLKVAEGGPVGVRMRVTPLDSLAGTATYKIMLVNRETGTATQVNATYRRITTDTTGRDAEGNPIIVADTSAAVIVNAISGGSANVGHLVEVHDSLNTGVKVQQYTDLALQPPSATTGVPIWARYMRDNGTPQSSQDNTFFDTDTVRMGTLPIAPNAVPLLFRPSGAASGTNRGDQVGISFTHLSRPPIGFYYAVWLIPTDTLQPPVLLGELTTPLPEEASLRDADVAPNGGVLTSTEILRANVLVRPAALRAMNIDLAEYGTVRLTLEAKDGLPGMSSVVVLEGPFVTPP